MVVFRDIANHYNNVLCPRERRKLGVIFKVGWPRVTGWPTQHTKAYQPLVVSAVAVVPFKGAICSASYMRTTPTQLSQDSTADDNRTRGTQHEDAEAHHHFVVSSNLQALRRNCAQARHTNGMVWHCQPTQLKMQQGADHPPHRQSRRHCHHTRAWPAVATVCHTSKCAGGCLACSAAAEGQGVSESLLHGACAG